MLSYVFVTSQSMSNMTFFSILFHEQFCCDQIGRRGKWLWIAWFLTYCMEKNTMHHSQLLWRWWWRSQPTRRNKKDVIDALIMWPHMRTVFPRDCAPPPSDPCRWEPGPIISFIIFNVFKMLNPPNSICSASVSSPRQTLLIGRLSN